MENLYAALERGGVSLFESPTGLSPFSISATLTVSLPYWCADSQERFSWIATSYLLHVWPLSTTPTSVHMYVDMIKYAVKGKLGAENKCYRLCFSLFAISYRDRQNAESDMWDAQVAGGEKGSRCEDISARCSR